MSSDVVIHADNLGKAYNIYKKPLHRLLQMLCRGRKQFYSQYWALEGVSVDIRRGETIGVIGRNGSGKSTFLQLVCGTLNPTVGSVQVRGRIAALLELGAGFNPEFTGRENVYLSASILGLTQEQINERYESIEDFAGIGDFIDQPVKVYSSGMYARLAFAVAAHVDADILIIDEILAVGDAGFTQKCMRFIRQFKEQGTILFVSHDAASIVNLCDRCLWLENGSVRQIGDTKEVCHNYQAAIEAEKHTSADFKIGGSRRRRLVEISSETDHRKEILDNSTAKTELKVFDFDPEAPWFGKRGASIIDVAILSETGEKLPILEGGEIVKLQISAQAHQSIDSPIIGFYVRDKLGQHLFGDNTFITYQGSPVVASADDILVATFTFRMPYLRTGEYSVCPAIAEGTQEHHMQHQWINDALIFQVLSSHVPRGIMGVAMLGIDLAVSEVNSSEQVSTLLVVKEG
jgi:lipopolysaccharide transport system ATP-binding protein